MLANWESRSDAACDESVPYKQAIGSLNYLVSCTRPDLAFAVSQVARHMQSPTENH